MNQKIVFRERICTEAGNIVAWYDQLTQNKPFPTKNTPKFRAEVFMSYSISKNGDAEIIYEFFNVKSV